MKSLKNKIEESLRDKISSRVIDKALEVNKIAVIDAYIKQADIAIEDAKAKNQEYQLLLERVETLLEKRTKLKAVLEYDPSNEKMGRLLKEIDKVLNLVSEKGFDSPSKSP